jgi:hypothetical protein
MVKAAEGCSLHLQESYDTLMDTLDTNKTVPAFPVVSRPAAPGEFGDFKGIISRARWGFVRVCRTVLCRTLVQQRWHWSCLASTYCLHPACALLLVLLYVRLISRCSTLYLQEDGEWTDRLAHMRKMRLLYCMFSCALQHYGAASST